MVFLKSQSNTTKRPIYVHSAKGKTERWFVDIVNVCPNENDPNDEYCFEELRARSRGWLDRTWSPPRKARSKQKSVSMASDNSAKESGNDIIEATQTLSLDDDTTLADATLGMEERNARPRKKKVMEVKGATKTGEALYAAFKD